MDYGVRKSNVATLDDDVRRITEPYQICRAQVGESLTCAHCGRVVEFTYRAVCGQCFLAGHEARLS